MLCCHNKISKHFILQMVQEINRQSKVRNPSIFFIRNSFLNNFQLFDSKTIIVLTNHPCCHFYLILTKVCRNTWEGSDYIGVIDKTDDGFTCMNWNDSRLDDVNLTNSDGQLVQLNYTHNYCRNPTNTGGSPWCFVNMLGVNVQKTCNVPLCGIDSITILFIIFTRLTFLYFRFVLNVVHSHIIRLLSFSDWYGVHGHTE